MRLWPGLAMAMAVVACGCKPNRARATVVLLHGYGAKADDLESLAFDLKAFGAPNDASYVLAEGPLRVQAGRAWFDGPGDIEAARGVVDQAIRRAAGGPVVVIGFSQGGAMALDAAARDPGITCVSALAPSATRAPLRTPSRGGQTRVFLAHGHSDAVVPKAAVEALRLQLEDAGLAIRWVPHPGGHEIPSAVRKELAAFVGDCLSSRGGS